MVRRRFLVIVVEISDKDDIGNVFRGDVMQHVSQNNMCLLRVAW